MSEETKEKIDTIGREEIVERLYTIIESVSENKGNTSFALDGLWGSGKTFVIEMLEKKLKESEIEELLIKKYFVVHYNCWQFDYYEEPLVAIVSATLEAIDENSILPKKEKEKLKNIFKKIGMGLFSVANAAIKNVTSFDVKKAVSKVMDEIKDVNDKTEKVISENNEYDKYYNFKKVLVNLSDALSKISEKYTIVFVVDELDRCLPEYSIKVLERLHHLTDGIDNTITLIATDKTKLEKTINTIYGLDNNETDYCTKYLQKFIKFSVKLDIGQSKENILEKYNDYFSLFEIDKIFSNDNIKFLDFFNTLFKNIDVREQEMIINKIMIIHKIMSSEKCDKSLMYLEILFTIIENYYKKNIFDIFNGLNFENYIYSQNRSIDLTMLNQIFEVQFYHGGEYRYIVNEKQGIKGFVCMILSIVCAEKSNKLIIHTTNDKNYNNQKYKILEQITKFRELMSIIDCKEK